MSKVICTGYKDCKMTLKINGLCDHNKPHEHTALCDLICLDNLSKCNVQGIRKLKLKKLKKLNDDR